MNTRHTLLRTALLSAALVLGSQAFAGALDSAMTQQIGSVDAQLTGKTLSDATAAANTVERARGSMTQKIGDSRSAKVIDPKDTSMAVATTKTSSASNAVASVKVPSKADVANKTAPANDAVTLQAAALLSANSSTAANGACGEGGQCGDHGATAGKSCCGDSCGNHAASGKSCCGDHATDAKNDAGNAPAPVSASLNGQSRILEGGCGSKSRAS